MIGVCEMTVNRRPVKRVKTLAAVVGGAALITLGTVGALSGGSSSGAGPAVMSAGEMTMGDTATAEYSETTIATSVAVPGDKAAPPCGFSQRMLT